MSNEEYLGSYADINVHRLMLKDEPRTLAYKSAIFANKDSIQGKIVLDVGCGTGILSIFCAQAGAKQVHAVESSEIAKLARKVVTENNFDSVITVHECPVEDLVLDGKVDIIVSEWMGFYLLHEGMLQSVLSARDKFLTVGGLMFPESASIWISPCELPEYFNYWDDVFGVKMKTIGDVERSSKAEPAVTQVKPSHLLAKPLVLATFALHSVKQSDLDSISSRILCPVSRSGSYQGICLWFVVNFPSLNDKCLKLSTSPNDPLTHWQQTAVVFPEEIAVEVDQPIAFEIVLKARDSDPRKYNMEFTMVDPETVEHPAPCECYMTKCIVIRQILLQCDVAENDGIVEEEIDNTSD